jgi:homoaconitase/3-isopropylmalate dehydratase large subunit
MGRLSGRCRKFTRLGQRLSDVFQENTSDSCTLLKFVAQATHSRNVFQGSCGNSRTLLKFAAQVMHSRNVFQETVVMRALCFNSLPFAG